MSQHERSTMQHAIVMAIRLNIYMAVYLNYLTCTVTFQSDY